MKLSFLIPVYNESRTLPLILDKLDRPEMKTELGVEMEMIFVDDGSTDDTGRILNEWMGDRPNVRFARHDRNRGKGAAIRTALELATGDVVIIQDADLEYEPMDIPHLMKPILEGRADVVFGSRNLTHNPRFSRVYYWGNMFLNAAVLILYGRYVSDMETCYKLMRRTIALDLDIRSNGFDIEPEMTAKLLRRGHPIVEIPIRYRPRTRAEGKKITAWDGIRALRALIYWRFMPISRSS